MSSPSEKSWSPATITFAGDPGTDHGEPRATIIDSAFAALTGRPAERKDMPLGHNRGQSIPVGTSGYARYESDCRGGLWRFVIAPPEGAVSASAASPGGPVPLPQVTDEQRERNERIRPDSTERCAVCGRPTDGTRVVHTILGSDAIPADYEGVIERGEDSGWWPIGPECAKRLPAGYVKVVAA